MKIVGVGAGPGMLTEVGAKVIEDASIIYGSGRSIELVHSHIRCDTHEIKDYSALHLLPADAVVLSTGDPMLSGLGGKLRGHDGIEVIPGISSMQVACARLGVRMEMIEVITVHGRGAMDAAARLGQALGAGRTVFMLPDKAFGVNEIAEVLRVTGCDVPIALCENLGYDNERVVVGTAEEPPVERGSMACVVVGEELEK
ncbi:MAG: cobalt-precorrin-7 (C(5))-methyltransferase [Methanosarcinales archaeon]|nr:cobalt-precorrin-7 (C(5))-methyltransferase [Methanosarcinales archaeon]